MGALGNLTRKLKKHRDLRRELTVLPYGPAARAGVLSWPLDDGSIFTPMEISRADLEALETVGEIQPSHPQRYASHGHEFKGRVFNGECNRSACKDRRATWFNRGTRSYYCADCARLGNRCNSDIFKKPLYVAVECNLTHDEMDVLYAEQWS